MNNFVFSQDPLLYSQIVPQQNNESDIKRQLNDMMIQYHSLQQQQQTPPPQYEYKEPPKDYLGNLDGTLKNLSNDVTEVLYADIEFVQLNSSIQQLIQEEIMRAVKWKINSNPDAVRKIERLQEIILAANKENENEQKKNLSELNDYIKNYSDMTFNEYKKLKQGN